MSGIVLLAPLSVLAAFFIGLGLATRRANDAAREQCELAKGLSGLYRSDFEARKKSPHTGMILAFFLGGLGGHRFYMGQTGLGILYLVFCWMSIPAVVGFVEVFLMPGRVRRFNADLAEDALRRQVSKTVMYTASDIEAVKESLMGRHESLEGRTVRTLDDTLIIYQDRDFNSSVVGRPVKGSEIRIASPSIVEGREWFEATLPDGEKGMR